MEARYNDCGLTASRLKRLDPYIHMFNVIGGSISSCSEKFSNPNYFIHQWELEEERKLLALEEEKRLKKEERKHRKLAKAASDVTDGVEYEDQSERTKEMKSTLGSGGLSLKGSMSSLRGNEAPEKPSGQVQDAIGDTINSRCYVLLRFIYTYVCFTYTAAEK
jgi:hypothetical protein